jgi:hypothetical protein
LLCHVFWLYANAPEEQAASIFRTEDPVIFEFLYRNTVLCNHSCSFYSTGREIRNWTAQYEVDQPGGTCREGLDQAGVAELLIWTHSPGWELVGLARHETVHTAVAGPHRDGGYVLIHFHCKTQSQPSSRRRNYSHRFQSLEQKLLSVHLD